MVNNKWDYTFLESHLNNLMMYLLKYMALDTLKSVKKSELILHITFTYVKVTCYM